MKDLPYPVTDIHVHIQPWDQLHRGALDVMSRGRPDFESLSAMMHDPQAVLAKMDAAGIDRIGMINYVAPRLMGFTDEVNRWIADVSRADPRRLLPFGGLDPRDAAVVGDPAGAVDRLVDLGVRGLKIHPPHQELRVNAYRAGASEEHLPALEGIYARCQEAKLPLMVHTGTSVFPGARSRYGDPMDCGRRRHRFSRAHHDPGALWAADVGGGGNLRNPPVPQRLHRCVEHPAEAVVPLHPVAREGGPQVPLGNGLARARRSYDGP